MSQKHEKEQALKAFDAALALNKLDPAKAKIETAELLDSLRTKKLFFYPACGLDHSPLNRFTHLCDAFIYCDYQSTDNDFGTLIERIRQGRICGLSLKSDEVHHFDYTSILKFASPDEERLLDFPSVKDCWGRAVQLTRHIGTYQRDILLFYFGAEAVTLYRNLFTKLAIAPRMICLKQCQDGFGGQNWSTFLRWDGPLGRAVWENTSRPEFIVSAYTPQSEISFIDDPQGHVYDWPWNRLWQEHRNWKALGDHEAANLASYVLPNSLRVPAGTPLRLAGGEFRRPLNGRTIVRLKRPAQISGAVGGTVCGLTRANSSSTLADALQNLRKKCVLEKVSDVHSTGCHFEDEASALYQWKWNTRQPRTLTIQCLTEGDLACYGPAADQVID